MLLLPSNDTPLIVRAVPNLVAVAALPPIFKLLAVPEILVPTKALGVPKEGVTKVGDEDNTTAPLPVTVPAVLPAVATLRAEEMWLPAVVPVAPVVAMLVPSAPAVVVISPVRAGKALAGKAVTGVVGTAPDVPVTYIWPAVVPALKPPPAAAHVPSPRQNVLADALVPLFKLATGKLPVAWFTGIFVRLLALPEVGVPKIGLTKVGEVAKTTLPLPVVEAAETVPVPLAVNIPLSEPAPPLVAGTMLL